MPNNVNANDIGAWNAYRARRERPGKHYAPVYVDVISVDGSDVKLRVPSKSSSKPKEITLRWDKNSQDVWMEYPSTLLSLPPVNEDAPAEPPKPGQSGYLYIEESVLAAQDIAGDPKWPDRLPAPPRFAPLRIWPTSILLTGTELVSGTSVQATIDLLDPALAAQEQTLELGTGRLEVKLTQSGFSRFLVAFPEG